MHAMMMMMMMPLIDIDKKLNNFIMAYVMRLNFTHRLVMGQLRYEKPKIM